MDVSKAVNSLFGLVSYTGAVGVIKELRQVSRRRGEHEVVLHLDTEDVLCPHCGEPHGLLVEPPSQPVRYTEDCSVCCQPIEVLLTPLPEGGFELTVRREND